MTNMIEVMAPTIRVAGQFLSNAELYALREVRVERALCLVGRATLRFEDQDFAFASGRRFALGNEIEVRLKDKRLFKGNVTGVSLEQSEAGIPHLTVTVDDQSVKLTQGTTLRNHANSTASDVLTKIIREAGIRPQVSPISGVMEYLLEAGSGLAYLNRICERTGMVWWFDGDALYVRPVGTSTGTASAQLGQDLIEFSVRASALRATGVEVTGWDPDRQAGLKGVPKQKSASGSTFTRDYLGSGPNKIRQASLRTAEWSPQTQGEADQIATSLYEESSSAAVTARGTVLGNADVQPATTITVANAGPASGSYLVTEVQHLYNARGFVTKFVAGPHRPSGLVDTLGREEPDVGFTLSTLVPAVVTNNKDPDNLGRIKVKFVHAPQSQGKDLESAWARLVTLGGGANRGMVMLPEVNDEVLIGFENADPRRPVVLGGLFSKKASLPAANDIVGGDGKVDYRRITSRTGHLIEIADTLKDPNSHILLKLKDGQHRIRLGMDRCDIEMPAGKPFLLKVGNASIEITASGDINIKGVNINLESQANTKVDAKANLDAKGMVATNIEGATVSIKAKATASLEASGPVSVKGAMVAIN